jgi:hypothetical protein
LHNNQWLFNYYLIIETGLLAIAGLQRSIPARQKPLTIYIVSGFAFFLLVWTMQVYASGIKILANRACIAEGIFLATMFFILLYRSALAFSGPMLANPDVWLCLGCIIYFGCGIPILGLLHYLDKDDGTTVKKLFGIVRTLSNIRYFFTGISFVLLLRRPYRQVRMNGNK